MSCVTGFIGAGRIAQAMAKGFIASGLRQPSSIYASDVNESILKCMSNLGVNTTACNKEVITQSDICVLAVKPNQMHDVLTDIAEVVTKDKLLVSIAAGVTIKSIEKQLPEGSRVVRVMPNTPILVSMAASVLATGSSTGEEDGMCVRDMLNSMGICEIGKESYLDAVTGLSGSGPAYAYMAIEALSDGGVKMGLPRNLSLKLAAQAMMGAAKMVLESGRHPGLLKDDVCSPGGTTISAMHMLEKRGFRASLMDAVEIATLRCKELADEMDPENNNGK